MNSINTTYLLAALLLIAGLLGFFAGASTGNTVFNLAGFVLVLIALAMFIGEAIGQARHAQDKHGAQDS